MEKFVYIIIGVIAGILVLLVLACCCCKKKKNPDQQRSDSGRMKSDSESETGNQNLQSASTTTPPRGNLPPSVISNIEELAKQCREPENSANSPDDYHSDKRRTRISHKSDRHDDCTFQEDVDKRRSGGQVNIELSNTSPDLLPHRSNEKVSRFSREVFDAVGSFQETTDMYAVDSNKNRRFKNLVSSDVRNELNFILRDSSTSPDIKSEVSPSPVYPSRLKEFSGSFTTKDSREKSEETKIQVGQASPTIPQPDYGTVSLSPKPPPYKRREFKGPYGADDLDDMNNPYTIKRGKQKRPSLN